VTTTNRSAAELLAHDISILGPELGPVFNGLHNDFYWLQAKWQEYVALFGTSPARVKILNDAAPNFFWFIQDTMWNDLLLHIARLTDKHITGTRKNLTFLALPPLIQDEAYRGVLGKLVDAAVEAAGFARRMRNRRLAHHDLALALGRAEPITAGSRSDVRAALTAFHMVLNSVQLQYFDSNLMPEIILAPGGATKLLKILRDGVQAEQARIARITSGNPTPDDFRWDDV
jgi:hypothetical protein